MALVVKCECTSCKQIVIRIYQEAEVVFRKSTNTPKKSKIYISVNFVCRKESPNHYKAKFPFSQMFYYTCQIKEIKVVTLKCTEEE